MLCSPFLPRPVRPGATEQQASLLPNAAEVLCCEGPAFRSSERICRRYRQSRMEAKSSGAGLKRSRFPGQDRAAEDGDTAVMHGERSNRVAIRESMVGGTASRRMCKATQQWRTEDE